MGVFYWNEPLPPTLCLEVRDFSVDMLNAGSTCWNGGNTIYSLLDIFLFSFFCAIT